MVQLLALLRGRKTYLVGAMMVLQGLYTLATGEVPTYANPAPGDALEMIGIGSGFMASRAGVQKLQDAVTNNGDG